LAYATPMKPEQDLKKIATQQRAIMLCILTEIVIAILRFGVTMPLAGVVLSLLYLAVAVIGAVFIFMLAISLYNTGAGIVLGILTLIPLLGLIVLLVVNGKATKVLRAHGIRVGLLGANPSTIRPGTIAGPPQGI
jgi:hypothetical protein